MTYINTGAYINNRRAASKKALKEALANDPDSVYFDGTSPFTPFGGGVNDIPAGATLSVVGPDPERSRKWYASVTVSNGKVKVS